MNTLLGTEETLFPEADDSVEGPFSIPPGFPFGSSLQTDVFVSYTNLLALPHSMGLIFHRWAQMEFFHLVLAMDLSLTDHSLEMLPP